MSDIEQQIVRVSLGARASDIRIGAGALAHGGAAISHIAKGRAPVVITDSNVADLHLETLERSLAEAGLPPRTAIVLPAGEKTKDFAHFSELMEDILARGIDRSTVLLALGGGVIGDIVGYAAASALRGIDFSQVPTTLLAQVDSSVGGKTGINSRHGKNLIGAFHQPRLVLADTRVLDTLPRREVLAGYAEVAKYGAIRYPDFFTWLENGGGAAMIDGDPDARRHGVAVCCQAKADIVGADERESGERALLNLGHTFGHGLEAQAGFGDIMLHGEAVAIGMTMAFDLSADLGLCPREDAARLRAHLKAVGSPLRAADFPGVAWDADVLIGHMAKDKKADAGRINYVLARGLGQAFMSKEASAEAVRAVLARWIAGKEG